MELDLNNTRIRKDYISYTNQRIMERDNLFNLNTRNNKNNDDNQGLYQDSDMGTDPLLEGMSSRIHLDNVICKKNEMKNTIIDNDEDNINIAEIANNLTNRFFITMINTIDNKPFNYGCMSMLNIFIILLLSSNGYTSQLLLDNIFKIHNKFGAATEYLNMTTDIENFVIVDNVLLFKENINMAFKRSLDKLCLIYKLNQNINNIELRKFNIQNILNSKLIDKVNDLFNVIATQHTTITYDFKNMNSKKKIASNNGSINILCINNIDCVIMRESNFRSIAVNVQNNCRIGIIIGKKIDNKTFDRIVNNTDFKKINNIQLPIFEHVSFINMKKIVMKLGLSHLFNEMNLSNIINQTIGIDKLACEFKTKVNFVDYNKNISISNFDFEITIPFMYYVLHIPTNTIISVGNYH